MKKNFLIQLAVAVQLVLPQAQAAIVEPWDVTNATHTVNAGKVFEPLFGKRMTVSEFVKGFDGKMTKETYTYLKNKADQVPAEMTMELRKISETKMAFDLGGRSFAFEAVDGVAGDFKINGNSVKLDFNKSASVVFNKVYESVKFKGKTASLFFSLLVPSAQADIMGMDTSTVLIGAGVLAAVAGLAYWNYSNCDSYETYANACNMNGYYTGGNATRFVSGVNDISGPKFFCDSNNVNAAKQCAWNTKMALNQNYMNGGQTYPVIQQQLSPVRMNAVARPAVVRSAPVIRKTYQGSPASAAPSAPVLPTESSSGGMQ